MSVILNYNIGLGNELNLYALYWVLKDRGISVKFEDPKEAEKAYYSRSKAVHHLTLRDLDVDSFDICTKEEKEKYIDNKRDIINRIRRKITGSRSKIISEEQVKSLDELTEGYVTGVFPVFWTYEKLSMVKQHIRFREPLGGKNPKNVEIAREIQNGSSVSIHFRRTDFLWNENSFLNITNDEYYDKAISMIEEKIGSDIKCYVFSDDKEFIRQKYSNDRFTIVDWNSDEDGIWDFWLMSLCKHNICANSSFSTWASLLNENKNKIMIRPVKSDAPVWYKESLNKMGYEVIEV